MRPGQQYNSSEVQDAQDRLRGLPEFSNVSISPVGDDPNVRDLLVDVTEQRTAQISAGIGINSNGGFGGQLGYEQQNFDITNFPTSWGEAFSDRAFTGAGQDLTVRFDPGTEGTDAVVSFVEPYLFDQPYSFSTSGYYETRIRPELQRPARGRHDRRRQAIQLHLFGIAQFRGGGRGHPQHRTSLRGSRSGNHLRARGITRSPTSPPRFERDTTNHGSSVIYEGTRRLGQLHRCRRAGRNGRL